MNDLIFRIISDEKEAKNIWNILSPHQVIDDEWDFRYAFIKDLGYSLHFIAGYSGEKLIGLLPLQKNNLEGLMPPYYPNDTKPFLEFFAGDDTDDNTILLKPEGKNIGEEFLKKLTLPTILAPLAEKKIGSRRADIYTYKYMLPLLGYANNEEYIESVWKGSNKKKLRQQMRGLYKKYHIEVRENCYDDLEILFDLNNKRFGEVSSFRVPYRRQIFKNLLHNFQVEMISVLVNGKVESVSYGIVYKKTYVGMNAGTNNQISDIGKLHVLLQIDRAIKLGCKEYDGGKGSGIWKEAFGFTKIPQYQLNIDTDQSRNNS